MNWHVLFRTDFLLDSLQLLAIQCIFGHFCLARLTGAAMLMLICTLAAVQLAPTPAATAIIGVLLYFTAVRILLGRLRLRRIFEAVACLFCLGAAAAGFAVLGGGCTRAAAGGILLLICLLRMRRNIHCCWDIELFLELDGLYVRVPALIDTGNRLHEHTSGLPVVIVEASAMPRIAQHIDEMDAQHLRTLPYGVLGGGGQVRCFRPDRLEFEGRSFGRQSAPPCWVALYAGRIPGRTRALAPPEFADAAAHSNHTTKRTADTPRRFIYGIFKHQAIHLRHGCSNPQGLRMLYRRQRPASPAADS